MHKPRSPRRVLIASANPLFREGLRNVYVKRWGKRAIIAGMTSTLDETISAMETLQPDLVILDHDDKTINRGEFLNRFVAGQTPVKIVLVSLDETGQVVTYDRRQLTLVQADEWLNDPWGEEDLALDVAMKEQLKSRRRQNMRHFIIVAVLVILIFALSYTGLNTIGLMPVEASAQSVTIDRLWNEELGVISFLFALIVVPLVYSLVVFRRKRGETGDGVYFNDNSRLEVAWTVVPLIIVLTFAYLGSQALNDIQIVDPQALIVNVTAFQWAWRFDYPDYGFTSNQLYLPVDEQVVLKMQSQDVIHSFWVPEFRVKQDVLPGRVTEYRIKPTLIGNYKVRCAELCGVSHSYMTAPVIVVSTNTFDAWVKEQQVAAAAAQNASGPPSPDRGKTIVSQNGCSACHSIDGSAGIGPTWKGLFGSKVALEGGQTVTADDAYLHQSIADPSSQIVKGFTPGMPQFKLTDKQIQDIIAYIETLK
jgi:cytochrome c oxidase subunit 2